MQVNSINNQNFGGITWPRKNFKVREAIEGQLHSMLEGTPQKISDLASKIAIISHPASKADIFIQENGDIFVKNLRAGCPPYIPIKEGRNLSETFLAALDKAISIK